MGPTFAEHGEDFQARGVQARYESAGDDSHNAAANFLRGQLTNYIHEHVPIPCERLQK